MNNSTRFNSVMDYIEDNLIGEIDINTISRMAGMSIYEFRRIFSFVVGIPLGEYIRKRRLSVAAEELLAKGSSDRISISDMAARYGYDCPTSFSRSFKAFHGCSPSEIAKGGQVNMYTRVDLSFVARGGKDIPYRLVEAGDFTVSGLEGFSDETDTECCEAVWNRFYEDEALQKRLAFADGHIYAVYRNHSEGVLCLIGEKNEPCAPPAADACITLPKSRYAVFTLHSTEDAHVNEFYEDILLHFLESGSYKRNFSIPNLEVYPVDMDEDGFPWEIWIPLLPDRCG